LASFLNVLDITPACKLLTNATMALHFRPLE
jgi:hypothetical protein